MIIREYKIEDGEKVYRLWQSTINEIWPIDLQLFLSIIHDSFENTCHFVAEENGKLIGFVASRFGAINESKSRGSILLILVDKAKQRKGLGKTLLEIALKELKKYNTFDVQLGAGSGSYFWPGVPENLPSAISFFESCSWDYSEKSLDLVANLNKFSIPSFANFNKDILITHPSKIDVNELLMFEKENFPSWYSYFDTTIKQNNFQNILIAKENGQKIVGSVLLFGPYKSGINSDFKWKNLLGDTMGGFGALGVSEEKRNQGVGMTISIKATEILKNRGVKKSYLGWTWLVDWYGKIGYKLWRSYQMSWKKL
jgi:ribosomal protein S18 acetylase RimI-like enzyme